MKIVKVLKNNSYTFSLLIIFLIASVFSIFILAFDKAEKSNNTGKFETFSSCRDMAVYINENRNNNNYYYPLSAQEDMATTREFAPMPVAESSGSKNAAGTSTTGGSDFSTTNIQVEGVDEADILKTDGNYIYLIKKNILEIFDIRDRSNPIKTFETPIAEIPTELMLTENKLVLFANSYSISNLGISNMNNSGVYVYIFNLNDRKNVEEEDKIIVQGNYLSTRLVGSTIYLVSNTGFYDYTTVSENEAERYIPQISYDGENFQPIGECENITHFGSNVSSFVNLLAIALDEDKVESKVMLGDSGNIYMSTKNLYLATIAYEYEEVVEDEVFNDETFDNLNNKLIAPMPPSRQITSTNTDIFKIKLDGTNINLDSVGRVPGTILNQFSMDEYYDTFRITTTINDWNGWNSDSKNNLYVLGSDMKIISKLEGLGLGEKLYSTRFMGDRAYLVTFRQVDPLFVVDLSNAKNPKVLGELKIPGYSDYLHPYDTNHIIGIGKDAEVTTGRAQGLKIALFDITDVTKPVVKSEVTLGARGSDSEVLRTHKAFLFDKEKDLLVIPAMLYGEYSDKYVNEVKTFATILGIDESSYTISYNSTYNGGTVEFANAISQENLNKLTQLINNAGNLEIINSNTLKLDFKVKNPDSWSYGQEVFNGFKVFKINLVEGIKERGEIKFDSEQNYYDQYYRYDSSRALFVENFLYTFKNNVLKINKLDTLELLSTI